MARSPLLGTPLIILSLLAACRPDTPREEKCRDQREPDCHPPCDAGSYGQDIDGDGIPDYADADMDGDGYPADMGGATGDCDDCASGVNPGVLEVAGDGIDQDCDGADLMSGASE